MQGSRAKRIMQETADKSGLSILATAPNVGGPLERKMKIKSLGPMACFLLALPFLLSPWAVAGKSKVDVRIRVNEGIGKYPQQDFLNERNTPMSGPLMSNEIFYFNVKVLSDNSQAVAKNDGQWCIKGDIYLDSNELHGTLSGNDLEIEVPQKNGKIKKVGFAIVDYKWRKLSDF